MNFDSDPSNEVALRGADALCSDVLPNLPGEADAFFRSADRALRAQGAFASESIESATRVAMRLAANSGSLAVVFASGFRFERARRLEGAPPATGSDRALGVLDLGASLTATGSGQTIRGESPAVIGGPVATHAIVIATGETGTPQLAHVDLASPAVSRIALNRTLGFDSVPVCALRFDDAATEPVASGSSVASIPFLRSVRRVLDAAIAVGIGRHAFRIAVEHLRSLGKRPSQGVEFSLSDVATDLDAAELSVLRAAWEIDRGSLRALESASAKLIASRAATHAAHAALVLAGNGDCTSDLRQCYLEACALEFQSETSAMQVATIASEMLEES